MGAQQNDLKNEPRAALEDRVLLLSRELDASPATVFDLWTDPEHLLRWWGPKNFRTTSCDMHVRPGGHYRLCIQSPEGRDYGMEGVYREVQQNQRLVFSFAWEENNVRGPETLVTVTFADHQGKTRLTFRQAFFSSEAERDSHGEGWGECLDKLAAHIQRHAA